MMDDMLVRDSVALVAGVPLVVILPALVELAKRLGMPVRWAGLAAITLAVLLVAVGDIALGYTSGDASRWVVRVATWGLSGVIYGLAAAGLYSQGDLVTRRRNPPMDS
jgi:hypothetical protein